MMKKKIIGIISFVLASVLLVAGVVNIYSFKYLDSVYKMKMFYKQQENTVDLLVLGSSHSYQGINTAVLWDKFGIPAYNLGGSAQPIWNTYFYLEEALKTQSPKAVIIDLYMLYLSSDYDEEGNAIKNTYGMKRSDTKKAAIEASFNMENGGDIFFYEFLQYHSRYSDLNKADFYPYQNNREMYENHKGFYCYFTTKKLTERELNAEEPASELTEKNEEYLRKTIELAQANGIKVILTALPFDAENFHMGYINRAGEIAKEYGVGFWNFLVGEYKEEAMINYEADFSDNQHLNYRGNTKITKLVGRMLRDEYGFVDRHGDEKYDSWEKDAEVYRKQLDNHNLTIIDNMPEYAQKMNDERYSIIVTKSDGGVATEKYLKSVKLDVFCANYGIDFEQFKQGGIWYFEKGELKYYNEKCNREYKKYIAFSRYDGAEVNVVPGEDFPDISIYCAKKKVNKVRTGVNIVVYDNFTKSVIDYAGYDFEEGKFVG